jgi:hypothetical protein
VKALLGILAGLLLSTSAMADSPRHYTTFWTFTTSQCSDTQCESAPEHYDSNLNEALPVSLPKELVDAGVACVREPVDHQYDRYVDVVSGLFRCTDGKTTNSVGVACSLKVPENHYADAFLPTKIGKFYLAVQCISVKVAR